ncbi:MAG: helix-turn-helix domain-containing protein [Candidatus Methanoperedens sp.]|nr:helix-turn-helix domain-containing protein [Candidatus Methanoperedens sp.]
MENLPDDIFFVENLYTERSKQLASEICNDTAHEILKELYKNPSSITDLSNKLNIPMSTVQYHIDKLQELGVIKISRRKLGKRLRDVKMYVYDKESIILLSSIGKSEFGSLLNIFLLQRIKGQIPITVALIFSVGSILSLIGSWLLKREIESSFILPSYYDIRSIVAGEIGINMLLLFLGTFFLLGSAISIILILLVIRLRK